MTEKRFMVVWDNNVQYIWDFGDENETEVEVYGISEADDLLNGLHEENQKLKQRVSELELLNDGLNYALKNIKKIDVEIDLND